MNLNNTSLGTLHFNLTYTSVIGCGVNFFDLSF